MDTTFATLPQVVAAPAAPTGVVFDIRKYSIHDGPGIRTTVFFKGCPLRCAWCHNPESQAFEPELLLRPNRCIGCQACLEACPNAAIAGQLSAVSGLPITDRARCQNCGACAVACYADGRQISGQTMSVAEVMTAIEGDRVFYEQSGGGVTFSGGEPLAQRQFLLALLRACKSRGLHTAVDTSGFAAWPVLEEIRGEVDIFLYDLKLMDDERHRRYTGVPNGPIGENLRRLSALGHTIGVRMPIIPGINDDEENIRQTGEFLASLPIPLPMELLAYHEIAAAKYTGLGLEPPLAGIHPPTADRMEEIARRLRSFRLQVKY